MLIKNALSLLVVFLWLQINASGAGKPDSLYTSAGSAISLASISGDYGLFPPLGSEVYLSLNGINRFSVPQLSTLSIQLLGTHGYGTAHLTFETGNIIGSAASSRARMALAKRLGQDWGIGVRIGKSFPGTLSSTIWLYRQTRHQYLHVAVHEAEALFVEQAYKALPTSAVSANLCQWIDKSIWLFSKLQAQLGHRPALQLGLAYRGVAGAQLLVGAGIGALQGWHFQWGQSKVLGRSFDYLIVSASYHNTLGWSGAVAYTIRLTQNKTGRRPHD